MSTQSALVRNTLLTLSYRDQQEELDEGYPMILALLSYNMIGMEEGFVCLRRLNQENVRIRLAVDNHMRTYFTGSDLVHKTSIDDFQWLKGKTDNHDIGAYSHIFLPVLSHSLIARLMYFDNRDPMANLILQALYSGNKVGGLSLGADPDHPLWSAKGFDRSSPLLKADMRSQLQKLRGYGVELFKPEQTGDWLNKTRLQSQVKKIVSQEQIVEAYNQQRTMLLVERNTIITPLARDLAAQYNIELKQR